MFQTILNLHWKTAKLPLLLVSIAAFAIPILSIQDRYAASTWSVETAVFLATVREWGVAYPLLATAVGLLLGTIAWARDHRGGHVYALTLPIARWRYVLLNFGVGAAMLIVPVIALSAGATIASWAAAVPEGLVAYPISLTIRFALTSLLAFSIFFTISAGTSRTAGVILSVLAVTLGAQLFLAALGTHIDFVSPILNLLMKNPGASFGGPWMLIDV
jgi:hypothetical protein